MSLTAKFNVAILISNDNNNNNNEEMYIPLALFIPPKMF
jgi:hypothetical protein